MIIKLIRNLNGAITLQDVLKMDFKTFNELFKESEAVILQEQKKQQEIAIIGGTFAHMDAKGRQNIISILNSPDNMPDWYHTKKIDKKKFTEIKSLINGSRRRTN